MNLEQRFRVIERQSLKEENLVEFNIKNLKFYKTKFQPQDDLDRSKVVLGFLSFLYSKLLGQLCDQKGAIAAFFVKGLNANYKEYTKKKKKASSPDAFTLSDFKYPYLGLIFYKQSPETVVDAEEIVMAYFSNILSKYVLPQRPLKPYAFYNYFSLFSPEDIKTLTLADVKKTIKPSSNPKYNGGKIDLTTVFISNYLTGTLAKEFELAKKEILANPKFFTEPESPKAQPKKADEVKPKEETPKDKAPEPEASGKPGSTSTGSVKKFYDNLDKTYDQMKDENPPRSIKIK